MNNKNSHSALQGLAAGNSADVVSHGGAAGQDAEVYSPSQVLCFFLKGSELYVGVQPL